MVYHKLLKSNILLKIQKLDFFEVILFFNITFFNLNNFL